LAVTSDSGPLIHLAKIGLLHLLRELFSTVTIPSEVKAEVVDRGKERGYADAILVEEAVRKGWIRVVDVKMPEEFVRLCREAGVDDGEAQVLRLAREKGILALIDDESPREFALSLGITVRGTIGVLVDAVKRGILTRALALRKFDELSDLMYMSGELYRLARESIEAA